MKAYVCSVISLLSCSRLGGEGGGWGFYSVKGVALRDLAGQNGQLSLKGILDHLISRCPP